MARATPVPDWVPPDLPDAPGVYAFMDVTGSSLYIGKSVNLRRRVRGYFYGGGPDDPRLAEMLRIARGVRARTTGSDLEARLEEAERILGERPPYNRALKRRGSGWYLELRWNEPFPRFRIVRRPRRSGARYAGPFWTRRAPERIRRLLEKVFRLRNCTSPVRPAPDAVPCIQHDLGLCTAPCAGLATLDGYRRQAEAAARALADAGYTLDLRERLARERDTASERLDFETAARHQARLGWLDELEEYRFLLDGDGRDRSWLIVLPGPAEGCRVLQPVAAGRVLPRRPVEWSGASWYEEVEDACYAVRVAELQAPAVLSPRDSVPGLILRRWLEDGASGGLAIDLTDTDAGGAIRRIERSGA